MGVANRIADRGCLAVVRSRDGIICIGSNRRAQSLRTSPDGEIGRRSGLKIRRSSPSVGVQVPLRAPKNQQTLSFSFSQALSTLPKLTWRPNRGDARNASRFLPLSVVQLVFRIGRIHAVRSTLTDTRNHRGSVMRAPNRVERLLPALFMEGKYGHALMRKRVKNLRR